MKKMYHVLSPRPGKDDKTFWHRVGTAWDGDKGVSITFDSLPLPDKDGKTRVILFEPREKDDAPKTAGKADTKRNELDDDIPF